MAAPHSQSACRSLPATPRHEDLGPEVTASRPRNAGSGARVSFLCTEDVNTQLSARVTVARAPERFPEWLCWWTPLRASCSLALLGCRAARRPGQAEPAAQVL